MFKRNLKFLSLFLLLILSSCGSDDPTSASTDDNDDGDESTFTCTTLPCFYTVTPSDAGNLGGVAGADTMCEDGKPSNATSANAYLTDGTNRIAVSSGQVDWVLQANTTYYQVDGTTIGTTDANALFDVATGTNNGFTQDGDGEYWGGFNNGTAWASAVTNCNGWTSNAAATGTVGHIDATDDDMQHRWDQNCDRADIKLMCVAL